MAQFLGDIAGMLELFAIAGGLVLLHRAAKEPPAKLLKAAGFVLVVGGISVGLCTSYYWFKYQSQGVFDGRHMGPSEMMRGSPRSDARTSEGPGAVVHGAGYGSRELR